MLYLHTIDHFTKFSAGSIVTTKKSYEIVRHFIHSWVSVLGAPSQMFFFFFLAENFDIEVKTAAAYSPCVMYCVKDITRPLQSVKGEEKWM